VGLAWRGWRMGLIVVGIDEAGYGTLLGPLVVAGAAFEVEDGISQERFGPLLREALAEVGLGVGGSKQPLFRPDRDLVALELPLLAFLGARGHRVARFDDLLAAVGVSPDTRCATRWYCGDLATYPVRAAADACLASAARLDAALAARGLRFVGFEAE